MEATKVSITCPSCATKYKVPDTLSVKKVTCKRCGAAIFLRLQGAFREKNGAEAGPARRPTGRYARMKSAKPVKMTALHYISAVVTLALLVVFVKMILF